MNLRRKLTIGVPALAALALFVGGIIIRERALSALARLSQEQSVPAVQIIAPKNDPPTRPLDLPGTLHGWYEAPIYAQVTGYVRNWTKDYGAPVKAGELLATIDTPSLDAEFAAAKANLAVAEANYRLAVSTAQRWKALAGTPAVSTQEVDVQVAAAVARKAELEAAKQNVARYAAQESFKRVVAPFDGVLTARLTDVGDYVNGAGGTEGPRASSSQLFTVADVHKLRVFVAIPQQYASAIVPGLAASLYLPSQPDKGVSAKFLTTARAFSVNTRTAVTELTVDNPDRKLWPGTYVDVHFQIPNNPATLTIPEQALIFDADGLQVAVLEGQDKVALRHVTLGYNLGQSVQVTSGLSPTDRLINNPPAGLAAGEIVRPVTPMPGYARTGEPAQSLPPRVASEYATRGAR
jgi:membrane fusion protein, multidrug efflux system